MSPLVLSWALSSVSGYGIYGLQILLHYLRRGGRAQDLILTHAPSALTLPPLTAARLEPVVTLGAKIQAFLQANPSETLQFNHAVLHGCGNDFLGFAGQDRVWGQPNIGCAAMEHLSCSPEGLECGKRYDRLIAISQWNADYLKSLTIGPVDLCYQGIDPSLFHPAPQSGLYGDRFVIFSGGKFEYRKGQDLVTAAFKRFQPRHPEALLVTAWQNLLPPDAEAFARAGHTMGVPELVPNQGLKIAAWLHAQGLPEGSFIALPFTHHLLMPSVLAECDLALFPNRCEGGTNLVAMEAMACGIPTYVSYNTGQKDLVDLIGCDAFRGQRPVPSGASMRTTEDWGETDVEEIVTAMENIYTHRAESRHRAADLAARLQEWSWAAMNEKLLQIVCF